MQDSVLVGRQGTSENIKQSGLPGPKGEKGDTGKNGEHGRKGTTGQKGEKGYEGKKGEQGTEVYVRYTYIKYTVGSNIVYIIY